MSGAMYKFPLMSGWDMPATTGTSMWPLTPKASGTPTPAPAGGNEIIILMARGHYSVEFRPTGWHELSGSHHSNLG
jgi:hypothetical protein